MRSLYTLLASYVRFHFISSIHFIHVATAIHNILSIIKRYVRSSKYQYVTISGVYPGDYHNTPQRQSIYEFRIEMQEQNFRDMTGGSAFQEIQEENFKDMKGGSALRIKEVRFFRTFMSRVRLDSRNKSMSFEESRHN